MTPTEPTERCIGCGAIVARIDGPIHRYMTCSCWRISTIPGGRRANGRQVRGRRGLPTMPRSARGTRIYRGAVEGVEGWPTSMIRSREDWPGSSEQIGFSLASSPRRSCWWTPPR
jgi:hypothetical protein